MLLLIFCSGLVSMSGTLALMIREERREAWRAGAVRDVMELLCEYSTESLKGRLVLRTETLLLSARLGSRTKLLRQVFIGVEASYVTVSVAVAVSVWFLGRHFNLQARRNDVGGVPTEEPADTGSPSSPYARTVADPPPRKGDTGSPQFTGSPSMPPVRRRPQRGRTAVCMTAD